MTVRMAAAEPLHRERNFILAVLLVLAGVAWVLLLWQSAAMESDSMGMESDSMGWTMGMRAPLFLAMWVVMMVAMMFPAAAPMVLTFARVHGTKRQQGQRFVPTWVFVGSYLLLWSVLGVAAFGAATAVDALANQSMWLTDHLPRIGGAVIVLAGAYQLSPLKRLCLVKCRSPLNFIMRSWRGGYAGSFRMGLEHGVYCAGCCWMLFVILLPLGVMNVAAMAAVALLICAERSTGVGWQVSRVAAVALVVYGALVMVVPGALPTTL